MFHIFFFLLLFFHLFSKFLFLFGFFFFLFPQSEIRSFFEFFFFGQKVFVRVSSEFENFIQIVTNENIIKNGSRFDLPDVNSDKSKIIISMKVLIGDIFGVGDFGMDPFSLIIWIRNHFWLPLSLVFGIWDHGCLPFSVHIFIPILGFFSLLVDNGCWNRVPIFGLDIFRIWNLFSIIPIGGLGGFRVQNFFRFEHIPIFFQFSTGSLFEINKYFIFIIGLHIKCIYMAEDIIFAANIFFDQMILPLVRKDGMNLLGSWAADIRSKHDIVGTFTHKSGGFQGRRENLEVTSTTVNILFMFDLKLNN
eukprot:Sdes_comp22334_c0_seq1m20815